MSSMLLPVRIAGTGSLQPGRAHTTAEVVQRVTPPRDAADTLQRTGIHSRHFAEPDQTSTGLGAEALREALRRAGLRPDELGRLIFVSSSGGDQLAPANANLIAIELGIAGTCDAFDLNNACMGFLTAFDLAARSIATGCSPVAIVAVELLSRFTTPSDPRPYLVLADAVGAVVLTRGGEREGVLASWLRNDGPAGGHIRLAHPGLTRQPETFFFAASNKRISENATDVIRRSTDEVLAQAGLRMDDIAWVVPHQPNGSMLRTIIALLGIEEDRVMQMVERIGSVGAASIPTTLDALWRSGRVRAGDRVLMVGVGAGIAYGAIVLQVGEQP